MDALDAELLKRFEPLYSSLVSDCAEAAGLGSCVLAPGLTPYHADSLRVVVGQAYPAQVVKTSERVEIDTLLAYVDAAPSGSVCVVAADEDPGSALWGGLMSACVQRRGAVGAVVDGGVRDLRQIADLDFPVFAAYRTPLDLRGRAELRSYGEPVVCRGVPVAPGDLVFADANGVVALPAASAREVLERCEERVRRETVTEGELLRGDRAVDVYRRHQAF